MTTTTLITRTGTKPAAQKPQPPRPAPVVPPPPPVPTDELVIVREKPATVARDATMQPSGTPAKQRARWRAPRERLVQTLEHAQRQLTGVGRKLGLDLSGVVEEIERARDAALALPADWHTGGSAVKSVVSVGDTVKLHSSLRLANERLVDDASELDAMTVLALDGKHVIVRAASGLRMRIVQKWATKA
jgi:hypothetical protein